MRSTKMAAASTAPRSSRLFRNIGVSSSGASGDAAAGPARAPVDRRRHEGQRLPAVGPGRARCGSRGGRGGDARVDDAARNVADHRRDLGERGGEQQGQLAAARSADHAETARRHARPASEPADGGLEVLERDLHQVGRQVLGAEVREGEHREPVRREQRGHALGEPAVRSSDHEHARTRPSRPRARRTSRRGRRREPARARCPGP